MSVCPALALNVNGNPHDIPTASPWADECTLSLSRDAVGNPHWVRCGGGNRKEPAVSALSVTAERDGLGQLLVAVGNIHTAESFPDSLA